MGIVSGYSFFSSYISFKFTYSLGKEFGSGNLLEIKDWTLYFILYFNFHSR